MKFELYQEEDGTLTFGEEDVCNDLKEKRLIAPNAKLLTTIHADSYIGAMCSYHRFMGWPDYIAMEAEEI